MNQLLIDAAHFLRENFDRDTSWAIPPSQAHLQKNKIKTEKERVHIPTPSKVESFSLSKKEEPKEIPNLPSPPVVYDPPKPAISVVPLGVDLLSDAVKNLFPQFATLKDLPQDKDLRVDPVYKKLTQADVVLFSFREGKESDLFLQNISLAISAHFCKAAVLDVKKWEISKSPFDLFFKQAKAKIFIGSETLYKKPFLLPFLKENPTSSERFLSEGRLILLKPFETYFTDSLQKKDLWTTLCAILKKTFPSQASS